MFSVDCTETNPLSQAHFHWLEIQCGLHHKPGLSNLANLDFLDLAKLVILVQFQYYSRVNNVLRATTFTTALLHHVCLGHRGCLIWVKYVKIPKQKFESQLTVINPCSVLWWSTLFQAIRAGVIWNFIIKEYESVESNSARTHSAPTGVQCTNRRIDPFFGLIRSFTK